MLKEKLLRRQKRFHEEYQKSIVSANGREEVITRDLADFDRGIELILRGVTYRECEKLMPRFSSVYNWILHPIFPRSFRDPAKSRKKINISLLEDSPNFAYLVGMYQAKVRVVCPRNFVIETDDPSLEHEVERCFCALHMRPANKKIVYKHNPPNQRIYYCSVALMSYISEITGNNSRIPHAFFVPNLMNAYLSGFCDAQARPGCAIKATSKHASILRKYPRIAITKKGNVPLMSAVNSALDFLGIASVYNPQSDPDTIYINSLKSAKRFIDLGLFRSRKKMRKLSNTYDEWKEVSELDYHGAYQKLKDQIILERESKLEKYVEPEEDDD